jgi:hypothetical protein
MALLKKGRELDFCCVLWKVPAGRVADVLWSTLP